ncbi:MAG: SpoIID/LytB domain-containing protein, partial [Candidatus Cloacimonadaceae bacterium]|nr:SpoIID/LytB domain-containing protein [Candidatus Cloacimonadaceae bacterium]
VYKGRHLLNQNILTAVEQTKGEILVYEGRIASATYHSSSGGKTDSSQNIWRGNFYPYLCGVTVYPEAESYDLTTETDAKKWINFKLQTNGMSSWERQSLSWSKSISRSQLAKNLSLSRINTIEIVRRGFSGRILSLRFNGDVLLEGEYRIRQAFGNLPSSFFYIEGNQGRSKDGNPLYTVHETIKLNGKGSGHGVGMCQVSTLQKARAGENYKDILSTFYPGTEIIDKWLESYE